MKYPNIFTPIQVARIRSTVSVEIEGKWVEGRPEGFASLGHRIRAAWLVWTGRADALVWPGGQ